MSCDCTSQQWYSVVFSLQAEHVGLVVAEGHGPTNYTEVIPVNRFNSYSQLVLASCEMLRALQQVESTILRAWLKIFDPEYKFHITSDQFYMGMASWICFVGS